MHSLVYANVLITGADRADEILYARSYPFSIFPSLFAHSVSHFYPIEVDASYNCDTFVLTKAAISTRTRIDVSSFTSHDNNSLRERDRTHEQLIHIRFALIYYGVISHGDAECVRKPMAHVEDIGIPAVGRLDKINTAVKRNAIKM